MVSRYVCHLFYGRTLVDNEYWMEAMPPSLRVSNVGYISIRIASHSHAFFFGSTNGLNRITYAAYSTTAYRKLLSLHKNYSFENSLVLYA
ncbi:hypothetical protein CEXT_127541 [Caerostris extrusa]|uniref:Uncharacterized protein n=1 Tax=Caerostris extrusa TaxID=172846 RepID=A0AAV4Y3H1_CAEEX|nr:hypothetical protein CEXT_127541 [Caerostris extrusa]